MQEVAGGKSLVEYEWDEDRELEVAVFHAGSPMLWLTLYFVTMFRWAYLCVHVFFCDCWFLSLLENRDGLLNCLE